MSTVIKIPKEVKEAFDLHTKYISSLHALENWKRKGNNKTKIQLFNKINSSLNYKIKNTADDGLFPSAGKIASNIDLKEFRKFLSGTNPANLKRSLKLDDKIQILGKSNGYHNRLLFTEANAEKLTNFIKSSVFTIAFNKMEITKRIEFKNRLSYRLVESNIGRSFITHCFFSKGSSDNDRLIFSYKNLKLEKDYINGISNAIELSKVSMDVFDFFYESSHVHSIKLKNSITRTSKLMHYNLLVAVSSKFDSKLDTISDSIEKILGTDPDWDDKLEEQIKIYKNKLNSSNPFGHNSKLWKKVKGIVALIDLISVVKDYTDDPSPSNLLYLSQSLVQTGEEFNSLFKIVDESSSDMFKWAGRYAVVIGLVLSTYDSYKAYEQGDYSVASGHALAGSGTLAVAVSTSSLLASYGAASFYTGIGGLMLIIGGTGLILFTKDALMKKWFQFNRFGIDWNKVNIDAYNPSDFKFQFKNDYNRQIVAFDSCIQSLDIEVTTWKNSWGVLNQVLHVNSTKYARNLLIGNKDFLSILKIKITDLKLIEKEVFWNIKFWSGAKSKFVWESESKYIFKFDFTKKNVFSSKLLKKINNSKPKEILDLNLIYYGKSIPELKIANGSPEKITGGLYFLIRNSFLTNMKISHMEIESKLYLNNRINDESPYKLLVKGVSI